MNSKGRLSRRIEIHRYPAGWILAYRGDVRGRQSEFKELCQGTLAPGISAHSTYKDCVLTQAPGMNSKIKRRTAKVFHVADHVPQDFANAEDFHVSLREKAVSLRRRGKKRSVCCWIRCSRASIEGWSANVADCSRLK